MPDTIIIALITGGLSLAGVIITALVTRSNFQHELDKRLSVMEFKQDDMAKDVKEHNNYAKHIPQIEGDIKLILEKISVANHRITDLEKKAG